MGLFLISWLQRRLNEVQSNTGGTDDLTLLVLYSFVVAIFKAPIKKIKK